MAQQKTPFFSHATLEKNIGLMIICSILVVLFAGLVQIVPLFFQHSTTKPSAGVEPYDALRLMGRDLYIREGCVGCHSQQIRMLHAEVQRYGPYSVAGESVFDRPFCGVQSVRVLIWPASASATLMTGIVSICATRAPWCPNRTCLGILG